MLFVLIIAELINPPGTCGHSKRNKFIHDDSTKYCTIASNPIIDSGIVYYEAIIENSEKDTFRLFLLSKYYK